jgi:hypothetical protein
MPRGTSQAQRSNARKLEAHAETAFKTITANEMLATALADACRVEQ